MTTRLPPYKLLLFGALLLAVIAVLLRSASSRPAPGKVPSPTAQRLEPTQGVAELVGDGASTKMRAIAADIPGRLSWRVRVPGKARLETHLSLSRSQIAALEGRGCRAGIEIHEGAGPGRTVVERELPEDGRWVPFLADVAPWEGKEVEVRLESRCARPAEPLPGAVRWSVPVLSPPRSPGDTNLLLITIDTLRADHLSAYGYARPTSPNIDRLARRGLRFENAETVQSATWPALTSLHTSLYPSAHGVLWNGHRMPEGLATLAEVLHAQQFSTSAFITNMTRGRHPGFSRLFLSRDGGQAEADLSAVEQALRQIDLERDRRFFMWVHLLSPHADYAPPPPNDEAFTRKGASRVRGEIDELAGLRRRKVLLRDADVDHVVGLYDGEIAFVDALVGQLLDALAEKGLERDTLVILTADHGEDLHEHNAYFFHSPSIYGSSMRIPLILALPGTLGEGTVTDHPASLVDVAPTAVGLLGLAAPPPFQGENLLPGRALPAGPVRPLVFGETNGRIFSVRTPEWRFVYNPEKLSPAAPGGPYPIAEAELYDQRADPREHTNRAAERPELVRALTGEILAWKSRSLRGGRPSEGPDPEALEELRALGYLAN
jgi:arylsulfatase A-like enzyme